MQRALLSAIAVVGAGCANIDPSHPLVTGDVAALTSAEIPAIVAAARPGAFGVHPSGPVYRLHVISRDRAQVFFGEHYGMGGGSGEMSIMVRRIGGKWQARGFVTPMLSLTD